jgi:hypothetical protein
MSDRPKLGNLFASPDRTAGLAGILPSDPEPEVSAQSDAAVAPPGTDHIDVPSADNTGRNDDALPPAAIEPPSSSSQSRPRVRVVSVVVDASLLPDFRAFASRTEQTLGVVALRAVEAGADELATHWRASNHTRPGRLFSTPQTIQRREEPGVSTQLRLTATDADILDQLVGDWAAPSRSALVNEALRRYVGDSSRKTRQSK